MREADTEGHTGCDSTDGKHPELADPQTQGVGSWLSGDGGEGVLMRTGYFWGEWKVLEGTEVVVVEHCLCAEGP